MFQWSSDIDRRVMASYRSVRRSRWYQPQCNSLEERYFLSVTLTGSFPTEPLVGNPVTWTASTDEPIEDPVYQFSVGSTDGELRVVRDFSPVDSFTWNPIQEGSYEILVTVKDGFSAVTGQSTSAFHTAISVVEGSEATISPTSNPLIALYSAPPSSGIYMRVEFRVLDSGQAWTETARQPIVPGKSTNFLVAGMLPETTYEMRHVLNDGTTSDPLSFTSGALPSDLTFPTFTQEPGAEAEADPAQDLILLQGIAQRRDGEVPLEVVSTLATDRMGNIVWYFDEMTHGAGQTTDRLVPGGTLLMMSREQSVNGAGGTIWEVDLAGNILWETNVAATNEKLEALGHEPILWFHHDLLRLPNGHTAVLGGTERTVDLDGTPTEYIGDMVLVFNENLELDWVWDAFDWLDTNRLPTQGEGPEDWLHSNSIGWSPLDANLVISVRSLDWVIKIDYANGTGDGDVVWRLGPDGDFTINSSDPYPWFTHQHDAQYIDDNTLLLFDNGNTRQSENPDANSRGQAFLLDEETMEATLVLNADLGVYARAVGSAQQLSNGNFVFTPGIGVRQTIEVLPDGTIDYLQSMNYPGFLYRSYIYDTLYGDDPASVGSASRYFDADGDRRADLLVFDPDSANWVITYADGEQETLHFGAPGDIAIPGDYDGDGVTDLGVYRPVSDFVPDAAHWFVVLSGGGVINQPFGAAGDEAVPADYDGEGVTDLGVYRRVSDLVPDAAHWFVVLSGGGVFNNPFGADGDEAVPADYDGDGVTDLGVYRQESDLEQGGSHWFAILSGGGVIDQAFDVSGDMAIPGDYDGDGKADPAIYLRESEIIPGAAHWFAILSSGGAIDQAFGSPEDDPGPADHDGDGVTELAVYRVETAEAYLLRSRDQALRLAFEDLDLDLGPGTRLLGPRWFWSDVDGDQES